MSVYIKIFFSDDYNSNTYSVSLQGHYKTVKTLTKILGNNFLSKMVSFVICQGVLFSQDKKYYLKPSKQP